MTNYGHGCILLGRLVKKGNPMTTQHVKQSKTRIYDAKTGTYRRVLVKAWTPKDGNTQRALKRHAMVRGRYSNAHNNKIK